jgi:TrpR family trp operon transcriptional repressor
MDIGREGDIAIHFETYAKTLKVSTENTRRPRSVIPLKIKQNCFYVKEQIMLANKKKSRYVSLRSNKECIMQSYKELVKAFSVIDNERDMEKFLAEILTESELEALIFRWRLMKDLYHGETQRHIAEKHRISLCKITRGSKIIKNPESITVKILKEMEN